MEIFQRRGTHLDDLNDDEAMTPNPNFDPEERLLRFLSRTHSKFDVGVVHYDEKLDSNVVLD